MVSTKEIKREIRIYEGYSVSDIIKKIKEKYKKKNIDVKKLEKKIKKNLQIPKDIKKDIKKNITPTTTIKEILKKLSIKYGKKTDDYKYAIRKYIKKYIKSHPFKKLKQKSKKEIKKTMDEADELPVSQMTHVKLKPKNEQSSYKDWIKDKILSHTEMITKISLGYGSKMITNKDIDEFYKDFLNCSVKPNLKEWDILEKKNMVKNPIDLINKIVENESKGKVKIGNKEARHLLSYLASLYLDLKEQTKGMNEKGVFNHIDNLNKSLKIKCSAKNTSLKLEICIASAIALLANVFSAGNKLSSRDIDKSIRFFIPTTSSKYKDLYKNIQDKYKQYSSKEELFGSSEYVEKLTGIPDSEVIFWKAIENNSGGKIKSVNVDSDDLYKILIAVYNFKKNMKTGDKLYNRVAMILNSLKG